MSLPFPPTLEQDESSDEEGGAILDSEVIEIEVCVRANDSILTSEYRTVDKKKVECFFDGNATVGLYRIGS